MGVVRCVCVWVWSGVCVGGWVGCVLYSGHMYTSLLSVLSGRRRSLAQYHNWLVRNTAYILMNFLPSKSSILQQFEGSYQEIQEQARCVADLTGPHC